MQDEIGPQMSAWTIETNKEEQAKTKGESVWSWDLGINNIADLLRYLDASKVSVQEFMKFKLYKKNVDKLEWLKELGQHAK